MKDITDPTSLKWSVARSLWVGSLLVGLLAFGYKNGWSPSDYNTLIVTLGGLGVFDWVKHYVTSGPQS